MGIIHKFDKPCKECGQSIALGYIGLCDRVYEGGHLPDCPFYDDGKPRGLFKKSFWKFWRRNK